MRSSTALHRNISGIVTQWAFHRVKEHPKRSLDEGVMTFRSWKTYIVKPSRADLSWPSCPYLYEVSLTPTVLHRHMNGILTQWDFHRVQGHLKRSSDEGVMTFQSWRSYVVKPSRVDLTWPSCPDLYELSLTPTVLQRNMNGSWTQLDFHIVKEHLKWSSDEEVMIFQSWKSYVVKLSRAYLTWHFPDLSELDLTPNVFHRHMNGILTQWAFHRV